MLIYNPNLLPNNDRRLDVVDICSSLAKFLKGVDIPADNIGVSAVHYGALNDVYKAKALQQNLYQLGDTAKRRGIKFNKGKLKQMISEDVAEKDKDLKKIINSLEGACKTLKSGLYGLVSPPWDWVAFHSFVAILIIALLIFRYNREMFQLLRLDFFRSGIEVWVIFFLITSGLFINMMMWHENWKGVFDGNNLWLLFYI